MDEAVSRRTSELHAELTAEIRANADRVRDEIRALEIRDRRDMIAAAERAAVASSAEFVQREMRHARNFPHPHATLEYALSLAPRGGMAMEFGVYSGTTLKIISAARDSGGVFGFDSFAGLPENWRTGFDAGAFALAAPPVVSGAELVVGPFDETLPRFLAEHQGFVDVLHVDSDLYSSAVTVLKHVGPRLRPGSVIVFDEFLNYPGWEQHEARAWQEYVAEHDVAFRYEAYTHDHEQVVVRLL
ncbi:MAG: class I SAM-dependent methyltransferase [Pseudonocardia sp.]|nr:class I SAM-dependent methyltransferase [Pseudonocardia sp.]